MTVHTLATAKRATRTVAPLETTPPAVPGLVRELQGITHLLTCGSVDDGKSTLIGRLLWDASDLYEDQRESVRRSGRKAAGTDLPDYSMLLDGLVAEREQGITIDIAWKYFDTDARRFVIIDSPGHEQYTRNMASGASHADVAIVLVDARSGVKKQTKRHAAILDLVGVKHVVLAVNKMDLVGWSEDVFRKIEEDFKTLCWKFNFWDATAIPLSAVFGDNVTTASKNIDWYSGPTLIEHLGKVPSRASEAGSVFRFPVQMVLRDGQDFRGLAGTVSSGSVKIGDAVTDVVSNARGKVIRIATMDGDLQLASAGQAVTLQLDVDLDISRGAVLSLVENAPVAAQTIDARFVWLSEDAFNPSAGYLLRTATDLVTVSNIEIKALLDLETMASRPSRSCAANDIAIAKISVGRPIAIDVFTETPATGTLLLVDSVTGSTVAGGIATGVNAKAEEPVEGHFVLKRDVLANGLNRDLSLTSKDREEFMRRANEVAIILRAAGVSVAIEAPPPLDDGMDPGL
ncbi:sulfate adenylyltransferase [Hyphomicrobium methylovorum]|uniref:GTP-binding protein n=1 Tax=Hyphomicrobium methylovorum TaxID=84 RepID=UPI0015E6D691|nr:GTP-binding protein [Hyphomicrobium methylovorum]MBA2124987.1 sulfate adenylyltransferase [Hyphomicrobium methylovorum]